MDFDRIDIYLKVTLLLLYIVKSLMFTYMHVMYNEQYFLGSATLLNG